MPNYSLFAGQAGGHHAAAMNTLSTSPPGPAAVSAPAAPAGPAAAPTDVDARAAALMLLLCLVWSLQQISLKAVAGQASPMGVVALRSLGAAGLLALLMRRRGERLHRARWRAGALAGALFGLEYLLVAQALQWTDASHVVVFLYTAPVFAALGLQARLPEERLGRVRWAGTALAFGGIALAFLGGAGVGGAAASESGAPAQSADALAQSAHALAQPAHALALWGDALALAAGAAWGATTVTIRCSALAAAPATETLLYQLLGAALLLGPAALLTGQAQFQPGAAVWAHLGFQTLVVCFGSFLAWFWLLRRYRATQLGVFAFLTPLLGVLLGAWLLGERLTQAFLAGSALVLAGIGLVSGHAGWIRWRARRGAGGARGG